MRSLIISRIFFFVIAFGLLFTPIFVQGGDYFVGGDDTRLYYLFTDEYLSNLIENLVSENSIGGGSIGYFPAFHSAATIKFIKFLKDAIPLNTQFLFYGLILSVGFSFFYMFAGIWIKESPQNNLLKILGSLMYISSPFLEATLYKHQLISLVVVAVMPMVLFLLSKSILEGKLMLSITASFAYTLLSANLSTIPWFSPVVYTAMPIFIFLSVKNFKNTLLSTLIFALSFVSINLNWIYHIVYSQVNDTGKGNLVSSLSSDDFANSNRQAIINTSTLFSPASQVFNTLDREKFNKFSNSSVFHLVPLFLILCSCLYFFKTTDEPKKYNTIVILSSLLISWFLVAPNISTWGPDLFYYLSTKIPLFTMYRNMYDKFALPMAMFLSLSIIVSLQIVGSQKLKKILVILFSVYVFVQLVESDFLFKKRSSHEGVEAKISGSLSSEFMELARYIKSQEGNSRYLWLPLNFPAYVSIEDANNPGHFYSGPSPLGFLTAKQDYAGQFSFLIPNQINLGEQLMMNLKNNRLDEVGKTLRILNAKYIILDKQKLPNSMLPFLYGENQRVLKLQTPEFYNSIMGQKIADFGTKYSLFSIKPDLDSERIYITHKKDEFPDSFDRVKYQRISSSEYRVGVKNLKNTETLVFLEPYYDDWNLYLLDSGGSETQISSQTLIAFDYANAWEIDPKEVTSKPQGFFVKNPDGSINMELVIRFSPATLTKDLNNITLFSVVIFSTLQVLWVVKTSIAKA